MQQQHSSNSVTTFNRGVVGVYESIPFDIYHAMPACSAGLLKSARRSMRHAQFDRENHTDTESLLIGRAVHTLRLEPEKFQDAYKTADQCTASIKAKKGEIANRCSRDGSVFTSSGWRCSQHAKDEEVIDAGGDVLTSDQLKIVRGCDASMREDGDWNDLLNADGPTELSLLWDDKETGVLCKARVDKLASAYQSLVDIKTTTDASKESFERAIFIYGYAIQAAHYLAGAAASGIDADIFSFVAVENDPPHCCAMYELQQDAVAYGERLRRKLIWRYANTLAANPKTWEGYPTTTQAISLPQWVLRRIERGEL